MTGITCLNKCIQDTKDRKLVPMYGSNHLTLSGKKYDNPYSNKDMLGHLEIVRRAIKMQNRGWSLLPHINGDELKFNCYRGLLHCTICNNVNEICKRGIQLECGCKFHANCLFFHVITNKNYALVKCPICKD